MKKAEAISILATSVRPREPKDRARYDEAVRMAIEALKSSEQAAEIAQNVKDGDSVFRQAAIDCVTYDVEHTIECLKALPSAQPDIIRCKDCKHRDKYGCCKYWKGLAMADIPIATDDYDFCSYAKRT